MKFDTQKRRKFLGGAPLATSLARAVSLWCWYYTTTEEFDFTVGVNGSSPITPWEKSLCTRYAAYQMSIIEREAHIFGVTHSELDWGKQKALGMTPKARVEWLLEVGGEPVPRLD